LVDAEKKKKRRWPGLEDDETGDGDVDDNGFEDAEVGADADFGLDDHDSTVADLGSENDGSGSDDDVKVSSALLLNQRVNKANADEELGSNPNPDVMTTIDGALGDGTNNSI
ncbi:hypothetical protein DL95DRAFT_419349, partial [Leptodontidium sp. 2 PMI_412]